MTKRTAGLGPEMSEDHLMTRTLSLKPLLALAITIGLGWPSQAAHAVTTRVWVSTSFDDFSAGEGRGALITSGGKVQRGIPAKPQAIPGASMVFSLLEAGGALYLGTGNRGELWRYRGGRARKLTTLPGTVIITCLTRGPAGVIYAGTLPEGRIYAIRTATGRARLFTKVAAQHVWALHYEQRTRTLFAATGPGGKLFAVNAAGRSRLYWDSKEDHLLSLARGPGGALYVGSAPKAIVYRILGPGRIRAFHDFAGNEIRALAGNAQHLYVAVNELKPDQSSALKFPSDLGLKGTPIKSKGQLKYKLRLPRLGAKKGKGGLFVLNPDGAAQQLYDVKSGYFTALELMPDGQLYASEGTRGRVVTVLTDRTVATAWDVKERQVLSLSVSGKIRAFGTGDGAALHVVGQGGPSTYLSSAYDMGNVSRFGVLAWRASGLIKVDVRSGNTAKPDSGWSRWAPVARRGPPAGGFQRALVLCPPGRYVQYRIQWPGGSRAVVDQVRLHFTPYNQAPVWESLTVGELGSGKSAVQKATWVSKPTTRAPTSFKISWKVSEPDGDPLVFRVYFRAVGDVIWRKIDDKPFHTGNNVKWITSSLPDGWYEIKVVASDERTNGASRVQRRTRISAPVLVDHIKPQLVGLRVAYPLVTGLARDSFSRITGIAYSIDGKLWVHIEPLDGNYDQEAERFNFRIGKRLKPGIYTLLVKAWDEAGNAQVVKRTLRVR